MKKSKSKNPLIIFFSIMMTNLYQTANPLGPDKGSKSKNANSSSPGKNKQKNPQFHYSFNGQIWIRDSHNSNRFFLSPIFNPCPPEIILNKVTDLPESKAWKQIFVNTILFVNLAMPELSGSWKPPANKNMVLEHKVIPVVKWGKLTQAQKIEDLKTKKIKLTGNTDFVSPFSPEFKALTQVGTDITTAGNRLQDRLQKLPFSRKNLADAITVLKGDVDNWCAMVKIKVDNVSPAEGVRICNDAGFEHKIITVRSPRKNEVKQGTESGTMYVYAEIAGFHQWQESTDAAHTIIVALDPTRGGILEVKGRTPKQEYWYRWRLVLSKGRYGDWSPWYPGTPQ